MHEITNKIAMKRLCMKLRMIYFLTFDVKHEIMHSLFPILPKWEAHMKQANFFLAEQNRRSIQIQTCPKVRAGNEFLSQTDGETFGHTMTHSR